MPRARTALLGAALLGALACLETTGLPSARDTIGPGINSTGGRGGGGTGGSNRTITVGDNFFAPDTVTIAVNDTVTWNWVGVNPHTVTFADGTGSGIRTSGTFQRFFGTAGTYAYSSTVLADSLMRGTVTVR